MAARARQTAVREHGVNRRFRVDAARQRLARAGKIVRILDVENALVDVPLQLRRRRVVIVRFGEGGHDEGVGIVENDVYRSGPRAREHAFRRVERLGDEALAIEPQRVPDFQSRFRLSDGTCRE